MSAAATGEVISVEVSRIVPGERVRRSLGDIDSLVASIEDVGLINPITVDSYYNLVAGFRRLAAVKKLGWTEVPIRVAGSASDALAFARIERDENTCREPFTPSEAVAMGKRVEAIEKERATERKGGRPKKSQVETAGKLPAVSRGRARDAAAEAAGMSPRSYAAAASVVDAAHDESLPAEVRDVARQAAQQMDETGKVDPAAKAVRDAKRRQAIADRESHAAEVQRDLYRQKAAKARAAVRSGMLDLDPVAVVAICDETAFKQWAYLEEQISDWFATFREARNPGLRVVNGGAE